MTVSDAENWIQSNLDTITEDGTEFVRVVHDTGDGTDCQICGYPHDRCEELIPVTDLAEQYHEAMADMSRAPSTVASDAADAGGSNGTGHDRFFTEAFT